MPSSPLLAHTGLAVIAAVAFLAVFAGLLTAIVSAIALAWYRARVGRLMALPASASAFRPPLESATRTTADAAASAWRKDEIAAAALGATPAESLYRMTRDGPARLARRYAVGGAIYALVVGTAAYFAFSQLQVNYLGAASHPLQWGLLVWIAGWPIVMTANVVDRASPARCYSRIAVYLAGLTAIGGALVLLPTEASVQLGETVLPGWSGESPLRIAAKWALFNAAPTALIVVFRGRRLRGVAPLVLAFASVVGAGLLALLALAFSYPDATIAAIEGVHALLPIDANAAVVVFFVLLTAVACLLSGLLGWQLLAWIRRSHARKTLSDQSLGVGSQCLVFAAFHAGILAYGGAAWALAPLLGLLAYHGATRRRVSSGAEAAGPALLVLRVFSLGRRSEVLFDAITGPWRHAGSVMLIAGTDLAAATVAPRQFLAFVRGRLEHLFVRSHADIDTAIGSLDRDRDADGRHRINDFFCAADTWQTLLTRLVPQADVVLMDLRRFGPGNAGCSFEIEALLRAVPAQRLVFVIDSHTDREAFATLVRSACAALPAGAPNAGLGADDLRRFTLERLHEREADALLHALCDSATRRPLPTDSSVRAA